MPTLQALAKPETFSQALANVPRDINQIIERPPVSALINAGAIKSNIEACLAIEITKCSNALSVGGNLRQGQSLEIAKELIAEFPHESLEDFCYCLRNGSKGKYSAPGKTFRFDVMVVFEWFRAYLDEKYEAVENKLMQEKDTIYTRKESNKDWLRLWKDAVDKTDKEGRVKTMSSNLTMLSKLRAMTDDDVKREGQEKPVREVYPSTSLSEVRQRELHLQYIRENYDARTAKPLDTWMEESEWLKLKGI